MNDTITLRVNWPYIVALRDILREAQFRGEDVSWVELGGWFSKRFVIRSNSDTAKLREQLLASPNLFLSLAE